MKLIRTLAATAIVIASTGPALAQDKPGAPALKGPVVAVDTLTMKGKVKSIDAANRRVIVEGRDGQVAQVVAGPDIRNFENVKVGDEVTVRYTQAQSLAIAKGTGDPGKVGEIRTKIEAESAKQASAGGKPGLQAMERTTMVANVFKIDRERGILTLRGTSGTPVDIKVSDKSALDQLKADDQVVVGYRQALALSIEPSSPGQAPTTRADAGAKK